MLDPPRSSGLALARGRSVGIDPHYEVNVSLPAAPALFRETSDAYFERPDPLEPFAGERVAMAFIDGMHLAEFALRDFINVERYAAWWSVVLFDDILPQDVAMAAREQPPGWWMGDVYKLLGAFATHRPDLICLPVETMPGGLLLVLGLDPYSQALREQYDLLVAEMAVPDPQDVPDEVLERRGALAPAAVLDASFWAVLREARALDLPRASGIERLREAISRDFLS